MVSNVVTGWSSSEEAVTQSAELLAADMTGGSCVLCLESLSRSALRQRFSQEHYDARGDTSANKVQAAGSSLVKITKNAMLQVGRQQTLTVMR
jgi:16S rRNA G966 N2-methylase RsmD